MKHKFFALAIIATVLLNGINTVFADAKTNRKAVPTNQLAALLPASDGVLTVDIKRLLSETVPQILSGKPDTLAVINGKIDEISQKTGLDLRQFEQVAVGVSFKQISAQEIDLEPIVLARGKYNAGALIALAKLASNGKYREEKIGSRSVYVFTPKEIVEQNKPQTKNSQIDDVIGRIIDSLSREVAVTSFDANTLAFGSLARVRETFETKAKVGADVLSPINRKPNAVMSFSAKLPNNLSNYLKLDNDEFGDTLNTIRQVSGSLETVNGSTIVSAIAKTSKAEEAQNLQEMLQGLQMLGKTLLGSSKGADKQVYARMIDSAKIAREGTEVVFDLQVPQNDINILLGAK